MLASGSMLTLESGIVLHSLPEQDSYYAFSVESGDQFRLNRTSFWVLEKIDHGIEWTTLLSSFLTQFDAPPQEGEADLRQLVEDMHRQGAVTEER